jgi:hypothetical protein
MKKRKKTRSRIRIVYELKGNGGTVWVGHREKTQDKRRAIKEQ